jgi:membrane-bound lytic murein transglycosylase B
MRILAASVGVMLMFLGGAVFADPPAPASSYVERPEVRAFVRAMVERHDFQKAQLLRLFAKAQRQDAILQAIGPAAPEKAPSWENYRSIFLSEHRIEAGLAFWMRHQEALDRARQLYGVPEEYVVAILGVETFYGRHTGRWRVLDALTTLAFDYPRRADFFRGELEKYLLLARHTHADALTVKGSYAGAIGIPQFMPSTYLRYAVDFDGDGVADLRDSAVDAIGSVANFLHAHGWGSGEAVQLRAIVDGEGYRSYADAGLQPRYALAELARAGIVPVSSPPPGDPLAALVELGSPDAPSEFRIGLRNFYVLTRYNRSSFYASAVADLAEALRAARN